jgi:hypothetical protein
MLKPLTLSLSLAVALGAASVSMAGGLCGTCGIASPQSAPSAQAPCASAQCETPCAPKHCSFPKLSCPKIDWCALKSKLCPPKVYTYEWVLKKKRVWCGSNNTCGAVPSSQCAPSPQASAQAYAAPQVGGSGQAYYGYGAPMPTTVAIETGSIPSGDEAPPAPAAPSANAPQSSLLFSTPAGN